jgi:hypothetical protein
MKKHLLPATDFKAHYTNEPSATFKESCLYLLKLTNIRIKDNDIY